MMHGPEKSDPVIVAGKPANKAEQPPAERSAGEPNAAERVERRVGTKGNAASKAGAGRRAGQACHRSWNAYGKSQRQELCQFFVYGGEQNCVVDPKICVGDRLRTAAIVAQGMSGLAVLSSWGRCQRPRP